MVFKRGSEAAGWAVLLESLPSLPLSSWNFISRFHRLPAAGRTGQSPTVNVRACAFGMTC